MKKEELMEIVKKSNMRQLSGKMDIYFDLDGIIIITDTGAIMSGNKVVMLWKEGSMDNKKLEEIYNLAIFGECG
jgi:hypothetical protein